MADYRVYFVGSDGHFKSAADIEAPDDQAAIARAKALADGRQVQVWARDRYVTVINERPARQA
jgi:hypothetical protein